MKPQVKKAKSFYHSFFITKHIQNKLLKNIEKGYLVVKVENFALLCDKERLLSQTVNSNERSRKMFYVMVTRPLVKEEPLLKNCS